MKLMVTQLLPATWDLEATAARLLWWL